MSNNYLQIGGITISSSGLYICFGLTISIEVTLNLTCRASPINNKTDKTMNVTNI